MPLAGTPRGNVATLIACPTCGRSTDEDAARFCGGCGELLRPRGSGDAAEPGPFPDPHEHAEVERLDDPAPQRRLLAAVLVLVLAVAAVVVAAREPEEVVTADGLGTSSGRTSNIAVTDISTEHWRRSVPSMPEEMGGGWVNGATRSGDLLVASGARTTTVDLRDGTVVGELPWIDGTPLLRDGALVVVVRDRLLQIDPRDGRVLDEVPLDLDVSPGPVFPQAVGDDLLVVARTRVSLLAADGTVRWRTWVPLDGRPEAVAVVDDGSVVLSDWGGLVVLDRDDGEVRWVAEPIDQRGPTTAPVVADGLVYTVEVATDRLGAITSSGSATTARDLRTGEIVWQTEEPAAPNLLGVSDGTVLVSVEWDERPVHRLDAATGSYLGPVDYAAEVQPPGGVVLGPQGTLIVGDGQGGVAVIDHDDGTVRWSVADAEPWGARVVGDLVLLPGRNPARVLAAEDGELLHEIPSPSIEPPTSIALQGRTAMVAPGLAVHVVDGEVRIDEPSAQRWWRNVAVPGGFVVNTARGTTVIDEHGGRRWQLVDPAGGIGWREAIAVVDGRLLVRTDSAARAALALVDRDGEPVGDVLEGWGMYSPVVLGDLVVGYGWQDPGPRNAGPREEELLAVRVVDDRLEHVWSADPPGGVLLSDGDRLYEATSASITRRDPADGSTVGTAAFPRLIETQRLAMADGVLVAVAGGDVVGIDAGTGDIRWERPVAARVTAGPVVAGDVVYVGTADGDVLLFGLDGERIASRDATDQPVRDLVAAYGLLVVVTDGEAFALGPKELPARATEPEPVDIGTVDVPVP